MKAILLFIAASGHAFNIASTLRLRGKWWDTVRRRRWLGRERGLDGDCGIIATDGILQMRIAQEAGRPRFREPTLLLRTCVPVRFIVDR